MKITVTANQLAEIDFNIEQYNEKFKQYEQYLDGGTLMKKAAWRSGYVVYAYAFFINDKYSTWPLGTFNVEYAAGLRKLEYFMYMSLSADLL